MRLNRTAWLHLCCMSWCAREHQRCDARHSICWDQEDTGLQPMAVVSAAATGGARAPAPAGVRRDLPLISYAEVSNLASWRAQLAVSFCWCCYRAMA